MEMKVGMEVEMEIFEYTEVTFTDKNEEWGTMYNVKPGVL